MGKRGSEKERGREKGRGRWSMDYSKSMLCGRDIRD